VKTIQTTVSWLSVQQKRGKLPRNRTEYATELREDMMLSVIENHLPHTHELLF
jgi:hypothetical protein